MNSLNHPNRRQFLAQSSVAAAAAAAQAAAQSRSRDGAPLRVGCLNVHNYSHLLGLWGPMMNPREEKKEIALTGMRITHCWDIEAEKSAEFARMYRCQAVRNFDDMVGKVDAVISGGYFMHPWSHILHQPYLEAGLPNLINRPFSNSLAKARKMIDTAKKHKATILCPSAYEYTDATARARAWVATRKIQCYSATNSFDEYPTHGVHGLYMIHRVISDAGNPVVSVAFRSRSWHEPPGVMTFEHRDKSGNPFFGTLHQINGPWGTLQIHTPDEYGGKQFEIQPGAGFPFNQTESWAPTIWSFERMAQYGEMPETFDSLWQKTRVFMAGWRSVLDGGKPIRLEEVPEEWEGPVELPARPGDPAVGLFKKMFG